MTTLARSADARVAQDEAVPLRASPSQPDDLDAKRITLVEDRWRSQDGVLLPFMRLVEENVRMLAGRQWDVWSDVFGRFVDPMRYMTDDEKRWRQRPVMDFLGYWFQVTMAKLTENAPIVAWDPQDLDEMSAKLAEVMDPISKKVWNDVELDERIVGVLGWSLAGGESYLMTRLDLTRGEERSLVGPAVLRLEQGEGLDPIERTVENVPYDPVSGDPMATLREDGQGDYDYDVTGEPATEKRGELRVDVCSPLEIRAEWGVNTAWKDKRWIIHRWFLPPSEVKEKWGVDVQANVFPDMGDESSPGYLERLLFGAGYFGATRADTSGFGSLQADELVNGLVCGYTMWEKPCDAYPKGRLLVTAGTEVLFDGDRPCDFEAAGPIRKVGFIQLPGRPRDSTPLEKMVPLQKRFNRVQAQVAEHVQLSTNPILLIADGVGIDTDDIEARPGLTLPYDPLPSGADPAKWMSPPTLSGDVWKHLMDIRDQLFLLGSITGNEGSSPTPSASGELVEQLRFNIDRPLKSISRNLELAVAGVFEDVLCYLPVIYDEEEIIHLAGDDNVVRTVTVLPDLFSGRVAARPILESAAPESRDQKQQRITQLYSMGAFGDPKSPDPMERQEALRRFLELSRFPDLTRATRSGGPHRLMAERNLGKLLRGEPAAGIPILEVYDLAVHAHITSDFMAGPDYLDQDPRTQEEIADYLAMVQMAQQQRDRQMLQQQTRAQAEMTAAAIASGSVSPGGDDRNAAGERGTPGASSGGDASQAA